MKCNIDWNKEIENIKSLLEQGKTRKEISKIYRINKDTLTRYLEKLGIGKVDKDYLEKEFWKKIDFLKEKNKGIYDYSLITRSYTSQEKLPIKCLKHGNTFYQILKHHIDGYVGCIYCKHDRSRDEFVKRAKKKHGNKYDYSQVIFDGARHPKVKIRCNRCGTEFIQSSSFHVKGEGGCPKCALKTEARLKNRKINWDDPEVVREFERLVIQERKPFLEIGKIFGISGHQVGLKAKESGIEKPPYLNIPKEEESRIRELARSCESIIEISRVMGVPRFYVQTRIDFLGILLEKEDYILDKSVLLKNLDYNTTISELAKKLNVRPSRIIASFKKHGLDISKCKLDVEIKKFINSILYLKRSGFPLTEISKILDITTARIKFLLKEGKKMGLDDNFIKFNKRDCLFIFRMFLPKNILEKSVKILDISCKYILSSLSSGEALVYRFLEDHNLEFKSQESLIGIIKGRKSNKVIIDFILIYKGREYWIEYNGIQHYKRVNYFKNDLDDQIKRDNNVRSYCKKSGIEFIEIPYTLDTFEKVSEFLTKVLFEGIDQNTLIDYNKLYEE